MASCPDLQVSHSASLINQIMKSIKQPSIVIDPNRSLSGYFIRLVDSQREYLNRRLTFDLTADSTVPQSLNRFHTRQLNSVFSICTRVSVENFRFLHPYVAIKAVDSNRVISSRFSFSSFWTPAINSSLQNHSGNTPL